MKHKETFKKVFLVGGLTISYIALFIVMFWHLFPYKPIEYFDIPYDIDKTTVYQGDELTYSFRYCKNMEAEATVRRWFIDGIIFETPTFASKLPVGCGTQMIKVKVPEALPPGEYHIKTEAKIQVNPIRVITITNDTEKFTVLEKE